MRHTLLAALLLASMHAQAQTNVSTIPTLKLFDTTSSGISTQFFGEVHVPEPLAYHLSGSGGKSLDFSIGWGHDTLAAAQQEARYPQSTIDQLAPVGERRASLARVADGYCAILTDDLYFGGRWNVLGPGLHSLQTVVYARPAAPSFGAWYDNSVRSVAAYKMIGSGCKPEEDIPMLRDANRRMYPLILKDGTRDQAIPNENMGNSRVFVASRYAKHYRVGGSSSLGYMAILGGGFSAAARTLSVPQCYTVTLDYPDASGIGGPRATFPPGNYTLANHGITNGVLSATVQRTPGCTQPPRPAPLKVFDDVCVHPNMGSPTPANNTVAVFYQGCKSEPRLSFSFTTGGSLRQASSGMCLHPYGGSATPAAGTPLVFYAGCDEPRLRFELTSTGLLRHVSSGMCAVPEGPPSDYYVIPSNATRVVLGACPANPLTFRSRLNGTAAYHLGVEGYDVSLGLPN